MRSSSRIRSVKSCGEVETTGKHALRKKSVSNKPSERQPSFNQGMREEFEEEFKRRTQGAVFSKLASREKDLQKWTSEPQQAAPGGGMEKGGQGEERIPTTKDDGQRAPGNWAQTAGC